MAPRLYLDLLPHDVDADRLIAQLLSVVRANYPHVPATSQDETIELLEMTPTAGGGWRARFRYTFDHDFAASDDESETFHPELELSADLKIVAAAWKL